MMNFGVAVCDSTAVGAQSAGRMRVLVVLTYRRGRFGVNPTLTLSGFGSLCRPNTRLSG